MLAGLLGLLGLVGPVFAQQAPLDMHGPVPPPPAGEPSAPLLIWGVPGGAPGAWSAGALLEVADEAAVRYEVAAAGAAPVPVAALETVVGLDVGGRWALSRRVALAATVPVFVGTRAGDLDADGAADGGGPGLGDAHLWVPVGLVVSDDGTGPGVGLVPWLSLPTGATGRLLGDPGASLGVLVAAGWHLDFLGLDGNLGLGRAPSVARSTQQFGGWEAPVGGAASVRLAEGWWLGAEVRGVVDLGGGGVALDGTRRFGVEGAPVEGLLTVRARPGDGPWGAGGVGRGLSQGVGAANVRGFLGFGYASIPEPGSVVESLFTFRVLDPAGVPVGGAEVLVGGEVAAVTDPAGEAALSVVRWGRGVAVRAPHHLHTQVPRPAEEVPGVDVVLPWEPSVVQATVVDEEGQPLDAILRVRPAGGGEAIEGRPGELELVPGTYEVEIVAEGQGIQVRQLEVEPTGRPPVPLEAVLLPEEGDGRLELRLADPDGAPIVGARVLVDGRPVGATADGGVLEIAGLQPGPHDVEVLHDAYTSIEVEGVGGDGQPVPLLLRQVPGTVRVTVRGPGEAVVSDAVARFLGPRRLAPMPLGARGERAQVLGPGTWTLLVTSPTYGVQERVITVPEDAFQPIDVVVVLQRDEAGDANLTVRVVDPSGRPVEGATVRLDGAELGATSTGGTLRLTGLEAGVRELSVAGEGLRDAGILDVMLSEGDQERVVPVRWDVGVVDVTVRGPEGPAEDAVVRFLGARAVEPLELGTAGRGRTTLPPGQWTVLVTSPTLGVQDRGLVVLEDSDVLHRVDVALVPSEGGLAALSLRVVDPLGNPVQGAKVLLDDRPLGATSNAGTLAQAELSVGSRALAVQAEPFLVYTDYVRLLEGRSEVEVVLDWAPGAVRTRVVRQGEPVTDAIVRFLGPEPRDPMPVDRHGERVAQLAPGTWTVLATSRTAGVADATVEIGSGDGLVDVEIELAPPGTGLTDLVLRVVGPDGAPLPAARVLLGDAVAGTTDGRGLLVSRGLAPGEVELRVEAPDFQPARRSLVLRDGTIEPIVALAHVPVRVEVTTVDQRGAPVAASVAWVEGASDLAPVATGATGVAVAEVPPGSWKAIASTADGALAGDARVDLARGTERDAVTITLRPSVAKLAGQAVVLSERVQFDFGKASLRPDSAPIVDEVARVLLSDPGIIRVEVQGHTDNIGTVPVNQALSQGRAEAVVAALVARGVPPEKLVARGYGTQRPLAGNDTEEGRATNRRVQFEIAERSE